MSRKCTLTVQIEEFSLKVSFRTSIGIKDSTQVVTVSIKENGYIGRGEGVRYKAYKEEMHLVAESVESVRYAIESGATREELLNILPPGSGRNAVDCALWDLEAQQAGVPIWQLAGLKDFKPVATLRSLSLDTPERMAEEARKFTDFTVLKLKVGSSDDILRIKEVRKARPDATITVDANMGWSIEDLLRYADDLGAAGVTIVEQPLPIKDDELLRGLNLPFVLCADESARTSADIPRLKGIYDMVNMKLDKTGGLTEGLRMKEAAIKAGFGLMTGCMVCTSLSTRDDLILAQGCEIADLDGPLWLKDDRPSGVVFHKNRVMLEP